MLRFVQLCLDSVEATSAVWASPDTNWELAIPPPHPAGPALSLFRNWGGWGERRWLTRVAFSLDPQFLLFFSWFHTVFHEVFITQELFTWERVLFVVLSMKMLTVWWTEDVIRWDVLGKPFLLVSRHVIFNLVNNMKEADCRSWADSSHIGTMESRISVCGHKSPFLQRKGAA